MVSSISRGSFWRWNWTADSNILIRLAFCRFLFLWQKFVTEKNFFSLNFFLSRWLSYNNQFTHPASSFLSLFSPQRLTSWLKSFLIFSSAAKVKGPAVRRKRYSGFAFYIEFWPAFNMHRQRDIITDSSKSKIY